MTEDQNKPESGEPEGAPATPDKAQKIAPKTGLVKEIKPPSRMERFMRKLVRGTIYAAVLFGAGILVSYVFFQRPNVTALTGQIEDLQAERTELEADVARMTPFETENEALTASLADAELHVKLLSALNDVQSARLALALDNPAGAQISLSRTAETLEEMRDLLPAATQSEVDDMSSRLALALGGLETDAFAAASDLEVLANSLLRVENSLFVTP